jgi:hypothetical protein
MTRPRRIHGRAVHAGDISALFLFSFSLLSLFRIRLSSHWVGDLASSVPHLVFTSSDSVFLHCPAALFFPALYGDPGIAICPSFF